MAYCSKEQFCDAMRYLQAMDNVKTEEDQQFRPIYRMRITRVRQIWDMALVTDMHTIIRIIM